LILETMGGQARTVHFGRSTPDGYTYARYDDEPSVLKVWSDQIEFLQMSYHEMISPFVWLHNIADVARAEFRFDGRSHVQNFLIIGEDPPGYESELDGLRINEANTSQLYQRMMDLRIREELPADVKRGLGAADMTVTLTFRNGARRTMTLHTINDRQVAVGFDGVYDFYVVVDSVNRLKNAIDTLLAGGNLPRY